MSLRWTLFLSYLAVVLLAVGTLGFYLDHEMEQQYLVTLETSLSSQANLMADAVLADYPGGKAAATLPATARRLGREAGLRVTIIAPDGKVLADSEQEARAMENHADRPEVRAALAHGTGRSIRHSATLGVDMLYLATAARRGRETVAIVRVALPLHRVNRALRSIRNSALGAAALALGVALLLSAAFSHRVTRSVRKLSRAARRLADGDLAVTVRLRGSRELVALAEVFNETAARLRETIQELRSEKQKIATILQELGEAVLVVDRNGKLSFCNPAAERSFGFRAERVNGLSIVDATLNVELDEAFRKVLATGEEQQVTVQVLFPERRLLEATVTALSATEPLGAVAVLYDATKLRQLEAVRREFVANASHELQTPVTAIKAMSETLLTDGGQDPALAERFLAELERQADRLGVLVKDLFDLSSIESGSLALAPEKIDLGALAAEVSTGLRPLAEQRRVAVKLEVPEELTLQADRAALQRVLTNLLDNALKYTEPGGEAGLQAARQEDQVLITVWDTGLGIPSVDLPRIFERFYRVDKNRSRALGGTGLGLAIVKHLVGALGGEIGVESVLGKGSRFTVTLQVSNKG